MHFEIIKKYISIINESATGTFSVIHQSTNYFRLQEVVSDKWTMSIAWKNSCEIGSIMFEWTCLKVETNSFSKKKKDYLSILRKVYSSTVKNE